jgi:hypothetical protein
LCPSNINICAWAKADYAELVLQNCAITHCESVGVVYCAVL